MVGGGRVGPTVDGAAAPIETLRATPASTLATGVARTPAATQPSARAAMATRIDRPTSCAAAAACVRGIARNVIPVALTKQARASAAVRARAPTPPYAAKRANGSRPV